MKLGIDAGGTRVKVVGVEGDSYWYQSFSKTQWVEQIEEIESMAPESLYLTGCGASLLQERFTGQVGRQVVVTPELDSFCAGARQLARTDGQIDEEFILVSMGTGTSIFYVNPTESYRVTGTATGGGTLLGLGKLLLDVDDFNQLMELAQRGDRLRVDLLVGDLYPGEDSPLLRTKTASNFGRLKEEREPADVATALVQLVLEVNSLLSIQAAETCNVKQVVFAGSPISHPLIRERLTLIGHLLQFPLLFLPQAPYSGALGSILLGEKSLEK